MFEIGLGHYLSLAAIIFAIGLAGVFLNQLFALTSWVTNEDVKIVPVWYWVIGFFFFCIYFSFFRSCITHLLITNKFFSNKFNNKAKR